MRYLKKNVTRELMCDYEQELTTLLKYICMCLLSKKKDLQSYHLSMHTLRCISEVTGPFSYSFLFTVWEKKFYTSHFPTKQR